jgi:hypothetical protein
VGFLGFFASFFELFWRRGKLENVAFREDFLAHQNRAFMEKEKIMERKELKENLK